MTDKDIIERAKRQKDNIVDYGNDIVNQYFAICSVKIFLSWRPKAWSTLVWFKIPYQNGYYDHCVLKLSDGRILDLFADKFNDEKETAMPEIYLGEVPEWYKEK